MISTTFEEEREKKPVTIKKIMEAMIGLAAGKWGKTPISKVVAAVRGIAISGPIPNMMITPKTTPTFLFTRLPRSVKLSPEITTDIMPRNGRITVVIMKPMVVQNQESET